MYETNTKIVAATIALFIIFIVAIASIVYSVITTENTQSYDRSQFEKKEREKSDVETYPVPKDGAKG